MTHTQKHLRNTLHALVSRNATLHQRLFEAGQELLASLREPDSWPDDLHRQARAICRKLTARGSVIDSIGAMDVPSAARVAEEIAHLIMAAEVAKNARFEAGGHHVVPPSKQRRVMRRPLSSN